MLPAGVFPHLIGHSAFVDRIGLSIWGRRRKRLPSSIQILDNPAIGGPGRLYARSIHASFLPTRNPLELRYGRTRPYPHVPQLRLFLRSEKTPLTAAQVIAALLALVRKNARIHLSVLEWTFDLDDFDFGYVRSHLVPGRRSLRKFSDDDKKRTLYLGCPTSPWQLRVYEKAETVLRIEFVFRLPFLRAHGIEQPVDVLHLRNVDLWRGVLRGARLRSQMNRMQRQFIW